MRHLTDLEAALKKKTEEARALLTANMEKAEAEGRAQTDDEKAGVEKMLAEARDIRAQIDRKKGDAAIAAELDRLTAGMSVTTPGNGSGGSNGNGGAPTNALVAAGPHKSLGQQWVESEGFEFFKRGGKRLGAWASPTIELAYLPQSGIYAATLTEAGGGAALMQPDRRPGIQELLFRRLVVADLIASGTTESTTISYVQETGFTNAADTVAEGGTKPESALTFAAVTDTVRKIAHWLPVTEEMLEDAGQIRSYIDARLRLGVELVEEDQLLQGSGVAPDILGIRNRTGISTAVVRDDAGGESNADAIYRQIAAIATGALIQPDGIVMNPTNWSTIELMKDDSGAYMAGGPFAARVGLTLWGLRVVATPAIAAGTATVGAWASSAQAFRRGGMRVEASNSHSDFFIKNLVAIRAEERLALAVYRPAAFGDVTTLE